MWAWHVAHFKRKIINLSWNKEPFMVVPPYSLRFNTLVVKGTLLWRSYASNISASTCIFRVFLCKTRICHVIVIPMAPALVALTNPICIFLWCFLHQLTLDWMLFIVNVLSPFLFFSFLLLLKSLTICNQWHTSELQLWFQGWTFFFSKLFNSNSSQPCKNTILGRNWIHIVLTNNRRGTNL